MLSTLIMHSPQLGSVIEDSRACAARAKREYARGTRLQNISHKLRERSAELKMCSHLYVRELKAHQRHWGTTDNY
ncbi:MAG TPA: hypothetical protein VFY67_10860 [Pyrinomonadaceae bacterium]|nr:hypothetical protein [Pyrinomonadaceae bacterium]